MFDAHAARRRRRVALAGLVVAAGALVVHSTWRADRLTLSHRFAEQPNLAASLFVAYGERDVPLVTEHVGPLLTPALEPVFPSRLCLPRRVVDGAGHNPPVGLSEGLRFVWQARASPGCGS